MSKSQSATLSTPLNTELFQMHANIVLSQDITEYAPLFSEIADAYFEREMYAEAGHIYEMLGADAGVSFRAYMMIFFAHLASYRQVVCTSFCKLQRVGV